MASHIYLKVPCFPSQTSISFDTTRLAECPLETCTLSVRHVSELRKSRTSDQSRYVPLYLYSILHMYILDLDHIRSYIINEFVHIAYQTHPNWISKTWWSPDYLDHRSQGLNRFGLQLRRGFRQQLHCNWEELERNVWDLLGSRVAQMQKNWLTWLGEPKRWAIGKYSMLLSFLLLASLAVSIKRSHWFNWSQHANVRSPINSSINIHISIRSLRYKKEHMKTGIRVARQPGLPKAAPLPPKDFQLSCEAETLAEKQSCPIVAADSTVTWKIWREMEEAKQTIIHSSLVACWGIVGVPEASLYHGCSTHPPLTAPPWQISKLPNLIRLY